VDDGPGDREAHRVPGADELTVIPMARRKAVPFLAAALLLGGCSTFSGGGAPAPPSDNGEQVKAGPAVASDAADALLRSRSVEVRFDQASDGGAMRLQAEDEAGGTVDLPGRDYVRATFEDGRLYISAPPSYWRSLGMSSVRAATLSNRITVRLPASENDNPAFRYFGFHRAAELLRRPPGVTYRPAVRAELLDGRSVVRIEATDGSVLLVANEGGPRPVRITGPLAAPGSVVDFDDYGNEAAIPTPQSFIDADLRG
jgi:hypothetical protein